MGTRSDMPTESSDGCRIIAAAAAENNDGVAYVRFRCGRTADLVDAGRRQVYYMVAADTGAGDYSDGAVIGACSAAIDYSFNYRMYCIYVTTGGNRGEKHRRVGLFIHLGGG